MKFTNRQVLENTDRRITERRIRLRLGSIDADRAGESCRRDCSPDRTDLGLYYKCRECRQSHRLRTGADFKPLQQSGTMCLNRSNANS